MKPVSVYPVVRLALVVGAMVFMAQVGLAQATSNGEVSKYLANDLFCDTVDLLEGDIGLLIGLILVFLGLWSMIQGAKILSALPLLITGAFITAIPSLILSTLGGLGELLNETGMSKSTFSPPECPALTPAQDGIDKAMKNSSGAFYPSRGSYPKLKDAAPAYCASKPEDVRCN